MLSYERYLFSASFFCCQCHFIPPDSQACYAVGSRCIPVPIFEALFVIVYKNLDFAAQKEYDNKVADDARTIEEVEGRPQCLGSANGSDNGPGTADSVINLDPDAIPNLVN